MTETLKGAAATRQALISTALRLFGEYGYNAVSTRKIADLADANIGSIAYHFGGKVGLMRACARYAIESIEDSYGKSILAPMPPDLTPAEARQELIQAVPIFVSPLIRGPDAEEVHIFVMRHLSNDSEAFDLLYSEFFCPQHRRVRQLFARATGRDPESEETRVVAFTILGQCLYFRIWHKVVRRNMGWDAVNDEQRNLVVSALQISLTAMLDAYTRHNL
ncbi:CerR family C-terminal domain-containing protein [Martelella mediterranea]|uniref:TetR family transcriptional regulator n=1 Tax=Martelella mediterranea TaxID=293089 RepID=A0A4R3NWC4_9HYPH|nr:CerR family C-terminal domain-containing protein [Martelella mediterranea]TCT44889.1 TetR family transcriptional regulator [Martelella mediterranea]